MRSASGLRTGGDDDLACFDGTRAGAVDVRRFGQLRRYLVEEDLEDEDGEAAHGAR